MSKNLQDLMKRIKTAENISKVAKAMEMIAASKIKKAQKALNLNKPYSEKVSSILKKILLNSDYDRYEHPYIRSNGAKKKLIIAISPDKGLTGGLTVNLFRKLLEFGREDSFLITIGKKIERFSAKLDYKIIASFPSGARFPEYSTVYPLIDLINQYYLHEKVSEVYLLFSEFRSIFSQLPVCVKLLPVEIDRNKMKINKNKTYIFEPDCETILSELIPYYIEVNLFESLVQAYTSEQGARMVAMQNANENAVDITSHLTQTYNKSRQEKITSDILDIVGWQV